MSTADVSDTFKRCSKNQNQNRLDYDASELGDGSVISQLLSEESSSCYGVLNPGEDDEMSITGYRRSITRTTLCWTFIILTCGILRLVMHWWRHWYLLATHSECPLDVAEKLLIREEYQSKHTVYHVKDVLLLNSETIKHMKKEKHKWNKYFALDENFDESQFRMSMHFSCGNFRLTDTIRLFKCKQLRYVWDGQTQTFLKLKGLDTNVSSLYLHESKGLSCNEQLARRLAYGPNQITTPDKGVITQLALMALNPLYIFQVVSVILWVSYEYYYYAGVIIFMSVYGITRSVIEDMKQQKELRDNVQNNDQATVVHDDKTTERVNTQFLVPGDLIEIPSTGCTMQCDAVLLSGNCILDESMLTGESVPVTKTPLPPRSGITFDIKEHSRHMLFCGTQVIQTRYTEGERVLAVVINTGNITAKGDLIRSILYPPPVDYKFEQDSYKFLKVLAVIAVVGFIYTLVTKIGNNESAWTIAIESLDLITIAVPPALPAAITIERSSAKKRLKKKNIYCTSPRSISVSGSINCVCFDKTGTLTEDGLDMWGVVPKTLTNQFQIPVKQIERLPFDHFLFGMAACHSITKIKGELKGDPLDLKMFESTGWILKESNDDEDSEYKTAGLTIVRPPSIQKATLTAAVTTGINLTNQTTILNSDDNNDNDNDNDDEEDLFKNYDIGIVRQFPFTSSLQRMSVITRCLRNKHFNVYCKGSPEMIQTLCRTETIPDNYHSQLEIYAQQGYRIIAIAYKPLNKKFNVTKIERSNREDIECDLEFQGFVILENRLKPDTTSVITALTKADIRSVMVTGDNILTAISVAKDCGIVKKQDVIIVNTRPHPRDNGKYEIYYNFSGNHNTGNDCIDNNCVTTSNTNGDVFSIMTNSNSITSLETTDTLTHRDGEMSISGGGDGNCLNDDIVVRNGQLNQNYNEQYNNYTFAMVGKTWSIVHEHFPELLQKFLTRGTVFARMSPDQKQSLILELQLLGYYVAMCGDGANDCGALKAAHTGISLSEAESSIASPFTSKNPTIACVPNVIKEGRASLVTLVGLFKYMAAYSLVQFSSVLILYSIQSNLTDFEYLYIDLCLISIFAYFFVETECYDGPLVKKAPLISLISFNPLTSLFVHVLIAIAFQIGGYFHLKSQEWFIPFKGTELDDDSAKGCHENYTIFAISCFQYIILAFVFSKGKPYRKSVISNYGFLISMIINLAIGFYIILDPHKWIIDLLGLIVPEDKSFRNLLLLYGLGNFVISLLFEEFVMGYKSKKIDETNKIYYKIEKELREDKSWPPRTDYLNDMTFISNEKSSPLAVMIHAEYQGGDIQTEFDENSFLNCFFDDDVNIKGIVSNDSNTENDYVDNDIEIINDNNYIRTTTPPQLTDKCNEQMNPINKNLTTVATIAGETNNGFDIGFGMNSNPLQPSASNHLNRETKIYTQNEICKSMEMRPISNLLESSQNHNVNHETITTTTTIPTTTTTSSLSLLKTNQ